MYCIVELFMSMPQSKLVLVVEWKAHQDAAVITNVCIEDGLPLLMASDILHFFQLTLKFKQSNKVFSLWHFQFPNETNELYVHTQLYENL